MLSNSLRKSAAWCSIILLCSLQGLAQRRLFTLAELSDSAKNHLPLLREKAYLIDAARASVADANHAFLPRLRVMDELTAGTDNSLAGSYFPLGIVPSTSGGIRTSGNYDVAAGNLGILYGEYDLVSFGLKQAKVRNAESYVDFQSSDMSRQLYSLQLEVSRLYFHLLKSQVRLSADKENVSRYQNIFTIINAVVKSGIKAGADTSQAKAELSRAQLSYNQTLGAVNQLKEQIAFITGIDASAIELDTLALRHVMITPGFFDPQVDSAQNPVIDYYKKLRTVYQTNHRLISKSYLPRLTLIGSTWVRTSSISPGDKYNLPSNAFAYQRFNYAVGLAFTYDLFNGVHKRDKLTISQFQLQAINEEIEEQKLLLNSTLRQAENSIRTTETNLRELPVQADAARSTYNQKLAQYKAGIINLIDLTNAAFVLYRSENDYIETMTDWYLSQLDKAAATNKLELFIQTIK